VHMLLFAGAMLAASALLGVVLLKRSRVRSIEVDAPARQTKA